MSGVILIGGTGTVGGGTAAALAAMGIPATIAARRPPPGGLALDVSRPETLAAARGHDAALLITPIGPDESAIGVAAVRALRAAGVGKIVYLAIMHLEAMAEIPHFAAKIPIKAEILADGRSVVVEANFFQSNDRMLLGAILGAGVYGLPVGAVGVQSVAPADLGQACANALTRDDWAGEAVPLCGPEPLDGDRLAANWADRLGRPVRYGGDAVEPFLAGIARGGALDPWLAHDMATMMRVTQRDGCLATGDEAAASRGLIGRDAVAHRDYIATLSLPPTPGAAP
jgi:uncharacterized protein YbjT (DUF2867 family)